MIPCRVKVQKAFVFKRPNGKVGHLILIPPNLLFIADIGSDMVAIAMDVGLVAEAELKLGSGHDFVNGEFQVVEKSFFKMLLLAD